MRPIVLVLGLLVLAPIPASAIEPGEESLAPLGAVEEEALRPIGRIDVIRAPLLTRPAFTTAGGSFAAELALPEGAQLNAASLQRGETRCALGATLAGDGPSSAWPDVPSLHVTHVRLQLGWCPPGLYDLHVGHSTTLGGAQDAQLHAVRVMDPARHAALKAGDEEPRIVLIADPQIGDPRGLAQVAQEDPDRIPAVLDGLFGDGSLGEDGLWKATRHALAEARALDPDFVLIAGDLGFGQLVPGSYALEYEEIWRVLAEADVPLFVAPGNHDGYVSNGQDGFAYWHAYLGPLYTLAPTVPGTHVLVMNTYDWSDLDRMGVSYGVSAWGGQVRDAQLAWIASALVSVPAGERILAVSHHSPGWRQDPWSPMAEGVPVAEQIERGARTYTSTDQGWIGENRLALRDLLRAHHVEVAFAGHTHRDRVARDDGTGGIVGTYQTTRAMPFGFDPRLLHHWDRDDVILHDGTQEDYYAMIESPTGPLYVDTTTPMSDTDQYWGYRPVAFAYDEHGRLDLTGLGYPIAQAELDALALHPENFDVAHARIGLFSTPLRLE